MMFELVVIVSIVFAVAFLLFGFATLAFGSRASDLETGAQMIKFSVFGKETQLPYSRSILACVIGIILLFLASNVVQNGGAPASSAQATGLLISVAHAQPIQPAGNANRGWVYFGQEDQPEKWNFEILRGGYAELSKSKSGVLIKSRRAVDIRKDRFGNLTGSLIGQIVAPEPPVIGTMKTGSCAIPRRFVKVGFGKIWIEMELTDCPS